MTEWRKHFAVPEGIYLLSHSAGAMPHVARAALEAEFLTPWTARGGDAWHDWMPALDRFCSAVATIIGCSEASSVCPQANVSAGLTKYLQALPRHPDRRCIVMHGDAFPSMGFVADALAPLGYELHLIPSAHDASDPDVWAGALTPDTAFALITHAHSNTGLASPVADIAAIARAREIPVGVDIAQSIGILPIDVTRWGVDMAVGSCLKWACGGPGAGFLWIAPARLSHLAPMDVGWFSHADPFEMDIRRFRYADDAKRFWGGTPAVAPFVMAAASLRLLADIGIDTIHAHNERLKAMLRPVLGQKLSVNDPAKETGTLCPDFGGTVDAVAARLRAAGVAFDKRGSRLRLSFHIFNTAEEAAQVADALGG